MTTILRRLWTRFRVWIFLARSEADDERRDWQDYGF